MPTKEKPKRQRKPKQLYLSPEMAPPSIPALDRAAETYVEFRDARMAALKEEVEAHDKLMALMTENKLTEYAFEGYTVTMVSKTKAKVRRKGDAEDGEG